MILPSDEDSRKPDDSDADDALPWENEPEPPGFFGDAPETTDPESPTVHHPAPEGWREDLREDLEDALGELKEIEDPDEDFDPPEPPDLFAFYGELVAMRHDFRLAAGTISHTLQSGLAGQPAEPPVKHELIAALVKLHDDLEDTDKTLLPSLAPVMKAAGLVRIKFKTGAAFDSSMMSTDDKVREGSKVAREIFCGWKWNDLLIRQAHVALK